MNGSRIFGHGSEGDIMRTRRKKPSAAYQALRATADHCWACGRTASWQDRPSWWNAYWGLVRAHVVNKPRIEEPEYVVTLCPLCHGISHGERYTPMRGVPGLTLANLLWLKRHLDPDHYDRAKLQRCCVGKLPRPAQPPDWYRREYAGRRGILAA